MGMFANAKTVETKKASAKPVKATVVTKGLERLAAVDAVMKSLKGLLETMQNEVKTGPMTTHFINEGIKANARPLSYKGSEGHASASLELRARAVSSALSEDDVALLTRHNIPTMVVTDTIETFVINPEYLTDMKLMGQVEEALKKVKGLPEDFIMRQEGKSKTVVAENALDVLFQKNEGESEKVRRARAEDLLPLVSTLAIKPKMETDDLSAALAIVTKILTPETEDEEEA